MFSFVRWYRYFHSVKDEMFYSTWLRLLNKNSIFHLMKIYVPLYSKPFIICILYNTNVDSFHLIG